jgi:N-acyl-D-aspartate/D-glutamate deacylase
MVEVSRRSLNWNLLQFSPDTPDLYERQLRASRGSTSGRRTGVLALMMPNNPRMRIDFGRNNVGLRLTPGFEWLFELTRHEFLAAIARADIRTRLHAHLAADTALVRGQRASMMTWRLIAPGPGLDSAFAGRTVRDIATTTNRTALDTVLDIAAASGGLAAFERRIYLEDHETQSQRMSMLGDSRVVVGGSDAGAHVDAMANGEYPTAAISELVNQQSAVSLEFLVREMTDVPAQMLGLVGRGRLQPGMIADIVLLDLPNVRPGILESRADLPGGQTRLYSSADGVRHVVVSGVETVRDGEVTGAYPGRLLRSGRDTL